MSTAREIIVTLDVRRIYTTMYQRTGALTYTAVLVWKQVKSQNANMLSTVYNLLHRRRRYSNDYCDRVQRIIYDSCSVWRWFDVLLMYISLYLLLTYKLKIIPAQLTENPECKIMSLSDFKCMVHFSVSQRHHDIMIPNKYNNTSVAYTFYKSVDFVFIKAQLLLYYYNS